MFIQNFKPKFIPKGVAVQLPLITGRNIKDLSLENVDLIACKLERLYKKRWQFSCHLITCRNVKDLSLEKNDLILF